MTLDELLDMLPGARRNGSGWQARCPAHDDKIPSLSVGEKDGKILLHCFTGCTAEAVVAALDLTMADLFTNGATPPGAERPEPPPPEPKHLEITEGEVALMEAALDRNPAAQEYLASRGISMEVARRLRFGYASHYFKECGELPAIAMPDFRDGNLTGVKYRSTEGKHFTHAAGSSQAGLFNRDGLDPSASKVLLFEGPLDAALALSFGQNAAALHSASAQLAAPDLAALKQYLKIYLIGDMDSAGQDAMNAASKLLPPEKISRVRLPAVKDIGELYAQNPATFTENLKAALRVADIRRPRFTWDDLETETELKAGGTGVLPCLVDNLLPLDDLTMLAGREGSCKTLLALYIGKCVANGVPVFGCLKTEKKPVLYLDAENHGGTHEVYIPLFENIGPEEIRWRTLKHGVPSLTDPALIQIVEEKRPLLIVDSLIRFCGMSDRDNTEMTAVMEQLTRLVTAGATVLLIHHTKKSDEEEYANSFAIGATVAFWYAVVTDASLGLKRVQMLHKKARGGSEINRNLIAFPAILDRGMFVLDGDPPKSDKEKVVEFVRARGGCNSITIKKELLGMSKSRKDKALKEAVEAGELVKSPIGREVFYSVVTRPVAHGPGRGNQEAPAPGPGRGLFVVSDDESAS